MKTRHRTDIAVNLALWHWEWYHVIGIGYEGNTGNRLGFRTRVRNRENSFFSVSLSMMLYALRGVVIAHATRSSNIIQPIQVAHLWRGVIMKAPACKGIEQVWRRGYELTIGPPPLPYSA